MAQMYNFEGRWMEYPQYVKAKQAKENAEKPVPEQVEEPKKKFVCLMCGKECISQYHLEKHAKVHMPKPEKNEEEEKKNNIIDNLIQE